MSQTILAIHNLLRWGVLLFGIWTVFNAISGLATKRAYSSNDNRSNLLFMIFCDIQLLFGLYLFFNGVNGQWWEKLKLGMKEVGKDEVYRFFIMEHAFMMIAAWILVHVGRVAVKKATPEKKHKKMLLYFGLALLIILISIPWPFKSVARDLFPQF